MRHALLALFLLGPMQSGPATAQCLLANPSFELVGSGGASFGGWNQFGLVSSSPQALHGSSGARLQGQDLGGWDVSAVWQRLDTTPGEVWSAEARVRIEPGQPLAGAAKAILNIEWRDAAGNLLSYETHDMADASSPAGEWIHAATTSGPAPAGAASIHYLLGVLQGPTDPVPVIVVDHAELRRAGPPSQDDLQWGDFPGGRSFSFAGRTWRVKGPGIYGPGPNEFCDDASCTWVDTNGWLHLTISGAPGQWRSTEVVLEDDLGYGDYIFTTRGQVDALEPNVVLGLFLWEYRRCYLPGDGWWSPYNEIDIEFSRWGNPAGDPAQYVAQPWDFPGNRHRFELSLGADETSSHAFRWRPDRVEYRSWRGGPADEATGVPLHSWTYHGPHIPRPEQPRVHLNLWYIDSGPTRHTEVVLEDFTFVPYSPGAVAAPWGASSLQLSIAPNPAAQRALVHFRLPSAGPATLRVFDARGRLVGRIDTRLEAGGPGTLRWDGRDAVGEPVPAGVYQLQLQAGSRVESRPLTWLR